MRAKNIFFLIFSVFVLLGTAWNFYTWQSGKTLLINAGGFGISPPRLDFNVHPGEAASQSVKILRSGPADRAAINYRLKNSDFQNWFSFFPAEQAFFQKDKYQADVQVILNVPANTAPGLYRQTAYFIFSSEEQKKGVGINLGARLDIMVSVEKPALAVSGNLRAWTLSDKSFIQEYQGEFIRETGSGIMYYVDGIAGYLIKIRDQEDLNDLIRLRALGVKNSILEKIPPASEIPNTPPPAVSDLALARTLAGKFLLETEQQGQTWFVEPLTFRRHYLPPTEKALITIWNLCSPVSQEKIYQALGRNIY